MTRKHAAWIAGGLCAAGIVLLAAMRHQLKEPMLITVQSESVTVAEIAAETAPLRSPDPKPLTRTTPAETICHTTVTEYKITAPDRNLNTADAAALKRVSGVGDVLAAEIVAYRESIGGFTRRAQLLEISGIGEALAARIMSEFEIPDELPPDEPDEPDKPDEPAEQGDPPEPASPANAEAPAETQAQETYDLNTVTKEQLMQLPDMTESAADAILKLREQLRGYQHLNELIFVKELEPDYIRDVLFERLYLADGQTTE
ncbi:MAG: helix-hairpin-helix domain-containing protein [Oscillospiraceae bacterium]|nr:helix-hairpin-helix domain-containing protein [Oscillospiraceae bacterium]